VFTTLDVLMIAIAQGVEMSVGDVIAKIVNYLRAGYPHGVPTADTIPLLALLRRRLSDEEVVQIATELVEHGDLPVNATQVRVMITEITDELPSPEEVERVKEYLGIRGWPMTDEFPPPIGR
jgi:hypothetical protein